MQIKKSKLFNKKRVAICVVLILFVGALTTYVFISNNQMPKKLGDVNYDPPTSAQKAAGDEVKEKAIERGSSEQTKPTNLDDKDLISFTSTSDPSSMQLVIKTTLANSVSWDRCFLTLTQAESVKSYEANVIYQPDGSFCEGFSIPTKGMSGAWTIKLKATELNGKSHETTTTTTIS